ncbi:MAG: cytochrome c biogenesis protein CcdA [Flavobacteriales bacterium]
MKRFFSLLLIFMVSMLQAQVDNVVKWSFETKKVSETEFDLIINADIDDHWHLYSQYLVIPDGGIGPVPTEVKIESEGFVEVLGKTEESGSLKNEYDPNFEMTLSYFEHDAKFVQRIKVNQMDSLVRGYVNFMVCDETQCLPPDYVDFVFNPRANVLVLKELEGAIKTDRYKIESVDLENPIIDCNVKEENTNVGFLSIFLLAFLSGFAALLTPCVFPMIPMTVSFFTKQSKTKAQGIKNAVFYGISIIVIYVLLGSAVTGIFGADALNALSTNVWFNLIFFVLLIVFAFSFLGAFEITLPSSWGTNIDNKADKGGMVGIFFMALALAIVSFSCTGPIVGTLLVEAASKGGAAPIIGMFGFSLAIALPFALFAAFPGWLNSLPKSGGWLNTVKVVLGFLELALAFKFLSNADLVVQGHYLEREVFLAIWIAIFGMLALYLFGKIQLPHDSPLKFISVGRLSLGIVVLTFTLYMFPGLWGAPLKLISAFPPPQHYSESPNGVGFMKVDHSSNHDNLPDGAHIMEPHGFVAFHDYNKGLAYAKQVNKPMLVDFTGWACVNCRKMEQNVWIDKEILKTIANDYVLVSLYVDEKEELPLDEQKVIELNGGKKKQLKTTGDRWAVMQSETFGKVSQPYYCLMSPNEELLTSPVAYTPEVLDYKQFLECGLEGFKKVKK